MTQTLVGALVILGFGLLLGAWMYCAPWRW